MRGSIAWQNVRHESGADVANTPRQLAKMLVDAPLGGGIRVGWETYYVGARRSDSGVVRTSGLPIGGHTVSHLALTGGQAERFEWRLRLRNLFDRQYGHVAGTEYSSNFPGVQQSPMPQILQDRRTLSADLRWYF